MSVDYKSCKCCGDARYEEAVACCNNCGENICNNCVEENKNPEYFFEDRLLDKEEGYLKVEFCPICKENSENSSKVVVWNIFKTSYFGIGVEVEIKKIIK